MTAIGADCVKAAVIPTHWHGSIRGTCCRSLASAVRPAAV